jgi:polysaccharide export outer membrane protein
MKKGLFFAILILPILFSCGNTRQATYFNILPDSTSFDEALIPEHIIRKKDILSISVSSLNESATEVFNRPNRTNVQTTTPTGELVQPAGYLVDQDGYIQFPQIGRIMVAGLTKKQVQDFLRQNLVEKKLLYDPIITIRILNYRVSVLGEVTRPMVVTVPTEKISLLEALSMAGDVTIFAKRNNVLVIREEEGKRIAQRIDLNSAELFTSPYYYLKANDVVYVQPNKARVFSATRTSQLLPAIISGFSVLIIVIDRLTR